MVGQVVFVYDVGVDVEDCVEGVVWMQYQFDCFDCFVVGFEEFDLVWFWVVDDDCVYYGGVVMG